MSSLPFKLRKSAFVAFGFLLALSSQTPAWSKLTAGQLTSLVRANARARVSNPTVIGEGPLVTVVVDKNPNASDKELKIDAVFLGKTLTDGAPGQVTDIKVVFYQLDKEGRYIQINSQQIKDFGSGKIEPDKFLASVLLIPVAGEQTPDVVQGPQFDQRLLLWKRIDHLRKMGTGVRPFQNAFKDVETLAASGKTADLNEKISNLERVLGQQENILQEAKRVARGKGILSASGGKSFGQLTPNSKTAQPATSGLPAGGDNNYIPKDAPQLRAIYSQRAETLIRQIEMRDRTKGQSLRAMKSNIDSLFGSNKQAEAFRLLHELQLAIQQASGVDMMIPGEGINQGGPMGGGNNGPQNSGPPNGGPPISGPPNGGPPNGGGPDNRPPF